MTHQAPNRHPVKQMSPSPQTSPNTDSDTLEGNPKAQMARLFRKKHRVGRFKGATLIELRGVWRDMTSEVFAKAAYGLFGAGTVKARVTDLEHLFRASYEDLDHVAHLVSFGDKVWDTRALRWRADKTAADCVYRVGVRAADECGVWQPIEFILDLAMGDLSLYDDIMQSVAPLLMEKKPTGVIWFLGNGAGGKSTLVHLLYRVFGGYLTELSVKQLEDERDTPQLNGKLGNVCKESSEGRVEDTRTYKCIGTHESFYTHKFHSQDTVYIDGNVHHIFSANDIPVFGDKSYGARRRTLVIPFKNQFALDETFEDRTFTEEFLERFVQEMVRYALILKEQGYRYKFSEASVDVKTRYDIEVNTADTYSAELVRSGVEGFDTYRALLQDYENWCTERGYKALSVTHLRHAMQDKDYRRRSFRDNTRVGKIYSLPSAKIKELVPVVGRVGLLQNPSNTAIELEMPDNLDSQGRLAQW